MNTSPSGSSPVVLDFFSGTRSTLGRAVSAEVRGRMAAERITGRQLAQMIGVSNNYLAKRLRDEMPFTLDDIDLLMGVWQDLEPGKFVQIAYDNHSERIWIESDRMREAERERREQRDHELAARDQRDYELAAHDEDFTIEAEQEADEHP